MDLLVVFLILMLTLMLMLLFVLILILVFFCSFTFPLYIHNIYYIWTENIKIYILYYSVRLWGWSQAHSPLSALPRGRLLFEVNENVLVLFIWRLVFIYVKSSKDHSFPVIPRDSFKLAERIAEKGERECRTVHSRTLQVKSIYSI